MEVSDELRSMVQMGGSGFGSRGRGGGRGILFWC
jgi:hypothetical protein